MSDVPARPASTVLVVRPSSDAGTEVLMVRRPAGGFFGGLMVFPGGALESCDFVSRARFDDAEYRMAGLRETAEEVGFVITSDGFLPSPPHKGEELLEAWRSSGIDPGFDRMTLISRWVTPKSAPTRFDTRFYLVGVEGDPEIVLDTDELEGHIWISPEAALEHARSGNWQMILPTLSHLRWLGRVTTVEEAITAADGADGETVIEPVERHGGLVVRYRSPNED